ncbi:MAG: hypothetical protein JST53_00490 [Actinobacteria bacterium]|nr:hypothetical protein [Actinomycetota bacterium]
MAKPPVAPAGDRTWVEDRVLLNMDENRRRLRDIEANPMSHLISESAAPVLGRTARPNRVDLADEPPMVS